MPPRIIVRRDGVSVSASISSNEESSIQLSGLGIAGVTIVCAGKITGAESTVVEVFDDAVVITLETAEEPKSE